MFSSTDSGWKRGKNEELTQPQNSSFYHGAASGRRCSMGKNLPGNRVCRKVTGQSQSLVQLAQSQTDKSTNDNSLLFCNTGKIRKGKIIGSWTIEERNLYPGSSKDFA